MKTKTKVKTNVKVAVATGIALAVVASAAMGYMAIMSSLVPIVVLSGTSPSGSSTTVAEHNTNLMIYRVSAQRSDVLMTAVLFELDTTDNAGTGWNTCQYLGSNNILTLTDDGGNIIAPASGWVYYTHAGRPCTSPRDEVAYAYTDFPFMTTITSNTYDRFFVRADFSVIAPSSGDTVQVNIPNARQAFHWMDDRGIARDARGVGLPVEAHELTF
jgi:hypothetical protein